MALLRDHIAGGIRRLSYHFLALLLVAAVFNSNETQGRKVTTPYQTLHNSLPEDKLESGSEERLPTLRYPADDSSNGADLGDLARISTEASTLKSASTYLEGIVGPLDPDDLEYALDYYNEEALIKEYDFESTDILRKLADSAMAQNTTSEEFLGEIQDLISLQNRSRTEQSDSSGRDDISNLSTRVLSENLIKRMSEGWKTELKRLEMKYNISSECTGPESITATRLALMFPHYLNFGQKPFAAPSIISVGKATYFDSNGNEVSYIEYFNRYNYGFRDYSQSGTAVEVPSIFEHPEFSGMIPRYPSSMRETERKVIIGIHLYAMHKSNQNDMVPFRTKCVMLKRRMEKSALSEARRIRFLENNDIFHMNVTLSNAFNAIPKNFTESIDWDLLEVFAESIS